MRAKLTGLSALFACTLTWSAKADEARDLFVEANILAIFYHELGHAVIDLMKVPIFGQEEDAADVMAVMLIDWLFTEDSAQDIAYDSAFGYLNDPEQLDEIAWWDLHGPDEQRFYNHVCLFYGGNPEEREALADDLGLPEDRAETCPEEYDMAADSWGIIFDEMEDEAQGAPMRFIAGRGSNSGVVNQILGEEVARMADVFALPDEVEVRVEPCGEANAFYDPNDRSITFCTEFIGHLRDLYDNNFN